jgi:hypothetical protein
MNRIAVLAIVCLLALPATTFSQTRSRTASKRGVQTSKASAQQAAVEARTNGATKVADQIKNLTRFLYLLGGVAKGIEDLDASARSNQGSTTALQQNEQNKAKLRSTFQDFRVGLDQLEITFRSTPELEQYYLKLAGSASGAATAEDQAAAGHFDQAGRTMLGVVNRLTDVLLAMR